MKRSLTFGLLTSLLSVSFAAAAHADSPLTSTSLAAGYESDPLVVEAGQSGMTATVAAALSDPRVPHDLRAAIVATFGWSIGGQDNAHTYLSFVAQSRGTTPARLRVADLSAEEALSLGYLAAMDDYLGLQPIGGPSPIERATPLTLLAQAKREAASDAVVALVHGLVRAQYDLHKNRWCQAWHAVFDVVRAHPGISMRAQALASITSYMALYQPYC